VKATCSIAQLVQEQVLAPQLEQELRLVLVQELAPVLQPVPEQVPQLVRAPERELQLVRVLVRHLLHQQLQSRFQRQRFRLLQHESLSTLQQLATALQYQLCL
jgi:hypothetical protein